ncbi:MAG: hypothetical protein WBW35_07945 [Xanthobacteraceae bacterium]
MSGRNGAVGGICHLCKYVVEAAAGERRWRYITSITGFAYAGAAMLG